VDQQPVDLSASILAILQAIGAILGAVVALCSVLAPVFPSWKNVSSKVTPVLERLAGVVHTVEGFRLSIPFTRYVFKGKLPPISLLVLALLAVPRISWAEPTASDAVVDLPARSIRSTWSVPAQLVYNAPDPYRALAIDSDGKLRVALVDTAPSAPADVKAQPSAPTATNEPAPAPPKLSTPLEFGSCVLSQLPGVAVQCAVSGTYKGPTLDTRTFWTILGGTVGNSLLTVGGILTLKLWPPDTNP